MKGGADPRAALTEAGDVLFWDPETMTFFDAPEDAPIISDPEDSLFGVRERLEAIRGSEAEEGAYFAAIRTDLWGDLSYFANPEDLTPIRDDWGAAKDDKRREKRTEAKSAKQAKADAATVGVREWLKTYTPEQQAEDARSGRPPLAAAFNRYRRNREDAGAVVLGFDEWERIYRDSSK